MSAVVGWLVGLALVCAFVCAFVSACPVLGRAVKRLLYSRVKARISSFQGSQLVCAAVQCRGRSPAAASRSFVLCSGVDATSALHHGGAGSTRPTAITKSFFHAVVEMRRCFAKQPLVLFAPATLQALLGACMGARAGSTGFPIDFDHDAAGHFRSLRSCHVARIPWWLSIL